VAFDPDTWLVAAGRARLFVAWFFFFLFMVILCCWLLLVLFVRLFVRVGLVHSVTAAVTHLVCFGGKKGG